MAIKHTEVFMVRHGQTDSNVDGLLHGATDVPLNGIGLRQAELVASRIEQLESLHSLHSSPLQRALGWGPVANRNRLGGRGVRLGDPARRAGASVDEPPPRSAPR